uniref:Putative secreted protein n=1 Tax=Anopheles marajoara TaxID=58244 RepID=A0A2M4C5A0_9DIPT
MVAGMKLILLIVTALCLAFAVAVADNSVCYCDCGNYSDGEALEEGSGDGSNTTVPAMPDLSGILPPWLGGGFPFSG